jgi:hypothetical protein
VSPARRCRYRCPGCAATDYQQTPGEDDEPGHDHLDLADEVTHPAAGHQCGSEGEAVGSDRRGLRRQAKRQILFDGGQGRADHGGENLGDQCAEPMAARIAQATLLAF